MNLYEKLNRLDDSKSLCESDEREYCIVAKTFDGKTKFYKDGAFVDDYKSCTTFNDLDDARSEWFDVDKSKYKRVFVPVYDPEAFAKVLTEGNSITTYLPPSIDMMLMDMAQMCGDFDYADIYRFVKRGIDEDTLRKLKNMRGRWIRAAEIEDSTKMSLLSKQAAELIGVSLKECNESVDDMDRRCEKCNTLLNDGGTCPKCDDGEEDLDESVDNRLQKDAEKILKYACDKPELLLEYSTFEDYIDELSIEGVFTIPESVPSVGFKVIDVENISETEAAEYIKLLLDKTWLRERLEELADSLVHNNGFRYDMLKDEFKVGDRVAHRYADEYNVGTIKDKRENEGIQYEVEWDYSEGDKVEWLYGDEITHWVDVAPVNEELSNREKLKRAYPELNLSEEVHNISGLSDEVEELIYDAVKEAYDVGKADFDLWRYIVEDLEAAGYEYDTKLAKRYFDELINAGASEFEYDDDIDYDEF